MSDFFWWVGVTGASGATFLVMLGWLVFVQARREQRERLERLEPPLVDPPALTRDRPLPPAPSEPFGAGWRRRRR